MAADEEQLLCEFQHSGSRDALRELLVAHQHRIYNACFQVLARAEDAEDAAQEVLLKIAAGARSAQDADSFRGWIYRVSIRTSLDAWRRREAARNRESRAAMNRPSNPPLDDRERIALFEAMDGLEDGERSLLLEHYFEKVPLEALGERRGISAVAIWKRIDRAREKLKKLLLGAGVTVAAAQVSEALESSVPATAPAALVGDALLGKIAIGGIGMATAKASVIPWVAILVLLVGGLGTYAAIRSRRAPTVAVPGNQTPPISSSSKPVETAAKPADSVPAIAAPPRPTEAAIRKSVAELLEQLAAAIASGDSPGIEKTQRELRAIGLPAVGPMREDVLGNPDVRRRAHAFQVAIKVTLMEMASPDTADELLKSWPDLDQEKYPIPANAIGLLLGHFAEVIARHPPKEIRKTILDLYAKSKRREIRRSLIQLMGRLLARVPDLREDLEEILLKEPDTDLKSEAAKALSESDAAKSLPAVLRRLEAALNEENSTAELHSLTEFLLKALPVEQALDRLAELAEKGTGRWLINNLGSIGFSLGNVYGAPGHPGLEALLARASVEKSRNLQMVYVSAMSALAFQASPDRRATDLALQYLDSSADEWVQSWALSAVTALNRDENSVLKAIDTCFGKTGLIKSSAGKQLVHYFYHRNTGSPAALEMIRSRITTGEAKARKTLMRDLCIESTPMPASVREIVKGLAESDADPEIRDLASKVLVWKGGPPPR